MSGRRLKGVAGTHDPDLKLHLFLSKGAWLRNNAGRQRNKEAGPRRGCDAGHRPRGANLGESNSEPTFLEATAEAGLGQELIWISRLASQSIVSLIRTIKIPMITSEQGEKRASASTSL